VDALLKATMAPDADVQRPGRETDRRLALDTATWRAIADHATAELVAFHSSHPLRPGMAREELRSRLSVSPASFPSVIQGLTQDGRVEEREGAIAMPAHRVELHEVDGTPLRCWRCLKTALRAAIRSPRRPSRRVQARGRASACAARRDRAGQR